MNKQELGSVRNREIKAHRKRITSLYPAIVVGFLGIIAAGASGMVGLKAGIEIGNFGTNTTGEIGAITERKLNECGEAPVVVFREMRYNGKPFITAACYRPSEPFIPEITDDQGRPSLELRS